jgi:hypothetical protein
MTNKRQWIGRAVAAGAALASSCAITIGAAGADSSPRADPCGTYSGRGCAPPSRRVDLELPSFTHPTAVTNPLFPIARLRSAVLLGRVDGRPFRSETTLLPGSATVVWNGRRIRVLLSQYMAFVDGRLDEVALDRYAQADDGSVWYLGEDVFDYRYGAVAVTEGTWLAGRDGPAAMIMPARPRGGDVFRTENIPGVVFEEVTVTATGKTVRGPRGPVNGAILAEELHLDGSRSPKTFAPGYGEFLTVEGADREALALAAPTDRLRGPVPQELRFLVTGAFGTLENARLEDWEAAGSTAERLLVAWAAVKPVAPPLIAQGLARDLHALGRAVGAHRAGPASRLAVDVARLALDLELRYRPVTTVDVERFQLWTQQLRVHAARHDLDGVMGDVATLEWVRERVSDALKPAARLQVDVALRELRDAVDSRNLPAAADHAARLGALVRRLAGGA